MNMKSLAKLLARLKVIAIFKVYFLLPDKVLYYIAFAITPYRLISYVIVLVDYVCFMILYMNDTKAFIGIFVIKRHV